MNNTLKKEIALILKRLLNIKVLSRINCFLFLASYIFSQVPNDIYGNWAHLSLRLLYVFLGFLMIFTFVVSFMSGDIDLKYICQVFIIFLLFAIFWDVNLHYSTNEYITWNAAFIGTISLNLSVIFLLVGILKRCRHKLSISCFVKYFKNNIGMAFILLLFIVLSLQNFGVWFRGDSFLYYNSLKENLNSWDFTLNTISSFQLAGHISYFYAMLLTVGEYIYPTSGYGVQLINLLMCVFTIALFYRICNKIFSDKLNKLSIYLLVSVFTFAPLFLGISYLISTDFAVLCFFIFFVYSRLYSLSVFSFFSSLCLCFSKETGVVFLCAYWFGEFLWYLCKRNNVSLVHVLKSFIIKSKAIYIYPSAMVLFHMLLGDSGWILQLKRYFTGLDINGATASKINLNTRLRYFLYKLEEIFLINYMWIITAFILIAALIFIYRILKNKKATENKKIEGIDLSFGFPFISSFVAFIIVNLFYFTYVHYRYIQLALFFQVILFGFAISYLVSSRIGKELILSVTSALFLFSSYWNIDLITYAVLPKFDAGNGVVCTTRRYVYSATEGWLEGDRIIDAYMSNGLDYNRQVIQLQYAMEEFFKTIEYDSSKLVFVKNFGGSIYGTKRILLGGSANVNLLYFWDNDKDTVTYYWNDDEDVTFENCGSLINMVATDAAVSFDDYSDVYYIDFPFNVNITDDYLDDKVILDQFDVSVGVWRFTVYKLK